MLQVRLLGGVAAERDGERVSLPPPAGRLLAVLALRPGPRGKYDTSKRRKPGRPPACPGIARLARENPLYVELGIM